MWSALLGSAIAYSSFPASSACDDGEPTGHGATETSDGGSYILSVENESGGIVANATYTVRLARREWQHR